MTGQEKRDPNHRELVKLSLITCTVILYREYPKECTGELLELLNPVVFRTQRDTEIICVSGLVLWIT